MPKTNKKAATKKSKESKKTPVATAKPKNLGYVKIDMSTMQPVDGRGTVYTFRKIP